MTNFKWLRGGLQSHLISPPIPPAVQETIATTLAVCSRQIEESLGSGFNRLPWISDRQDDITANYALGFLQGSFLSAHRDSMRVNEDVDPPRMRLLSPCAVVVVAGLFEFRSMLPDQVEKRVAGCRERLPQFRGAKAFGEWLEIEMDGEADAIALVEGKPMPEGGHLRMLLDGSITPEERELLSRST